MQLSRLLLAAFLVLCVANAAYASEQATWTTADSLPSLYNAYAAYCDPYFLSNWTCGFCQHNPSAKFVGFLNDHLTSVFGYVIILNNEVVVTFRGSECIMNWIDNLNFWWTQYTPVPKAYVHRGFWNAYLMVQSQVRSTVATALQQCPTCRTIRSVGHSLGGALATHSAADLSFIYKQGGSIGLKLTTFGSPRVGDVNFSSWLNAQLTSSWRMTHYCDPVPHLPPTLHEINWHHVATEIYEGSTSTNYKQCNGSGEDPSCADGILLPFQPKDHLSYMGVFVEAGKSDRCQRNGPDCSVFLDKYMNMNWDAKIQAMALETRG